MTESFASWLVDGRTAGHVALERGAERIRFGEVLALVRAVQHDLRAAGVEAGQCIALRDFDVVYWPLVALAVIDGGWIFYPAPRHGHDRVDDAELARVAPRYVLTRGDRPGSGPPIVGEAALEAGDAAPLRLTIAEAPPLDDRVAVSPDVAYLVATSGTTGAAKVIAGSRRGLRHFIEWQCTRLAAAHDLRFSHLTSPTFDPVYREVLVSLRCEATQVHREATDGPGSAEALVDWLDARQISVLHCVPTLLRVIARECARAGRSLPALRWIFSAGDHLRWLDVEKVRRYAAPRSALFNLYGPSETTLAKFACEVDTDAAPAGARSEVVPVGRPIPGATAIILDETGSVCTGGEVGEIYIRSEFASCGYWRDPERTAERFVVNRFAPGSSVRLFRTGDLGRRRPDGSFELLGRTDGNIKVHGRWVDLAAVEAVIAREIEPCACCVVECAEDGASAPDIVCVHTCQALPATGVERERLLRNLPAHALPGRWLYLDELPVNTHGKYDRRGLAALAREAPVSRAEPPGSELEAALLAIWRDALPESPEPLGVTLDFAAAGGHSIDAVRVVARIASELGVDLSLRTLATTGTITRLVPHVLAAAVRQANAGAGPPFEPPPCNGETWPDYFSARLRSDRRAADTFWRALAGRLRRTASPPRDGRREAVLSDAQRRFLALEQRNPGNRSLIHVAASWIPGQLNAAALCAAVDVVVARHAALRTSIEAGAQKVHDAVRATIDIHGPLDLARDEIEARARADAARPFALDVAPLLRFRVYQAADRFLLVVSGHVIVSDGLSKALWFRDLSTAYGTAVRGEAIALAPEPASFADFATWSHESQRGHTSDGYWRLALRGAPWRAALPYDRAPTGAINERGDTVPVELDDCATASLAAAARALYVPRSIVILAHLLDALSAWSGQTALLVALPHLNRPDARLLETTGCFTDSILLNLELSGRTTFAERVAHVASTLYDGMDHADASFERICDAVGLDASRYDPSVVPIMYAPQPDYASELTLGQDAVEQVNLAPRTAIFHLHAFVREAAGAVKVELNYSTAVFDRATIVRLAGLLADRVSGFAALAPVAPSATPPPDGSEWP